MKPVIKLAAASLFAIFATSQVNAATVTFTGNGTFSGLSNRSGCSISGGGNVLDMSGNNNSTLTITDVSNSVSTNTNDTVLGYITWVNRASTGTDQNFNVNYTFALSFTSPSNQSDSQIFNLISQRWKFFYQPFQLVVKWRDSENLIAHSINPSAVLLLTFLA